MHLGLGLGSKVALAVIMVFFVVFANAFQGVREADRAMIANAQILGAAPGSHPLGDDSVGDELDLRQPSCELRLRDRRRDRGRILRRTLGIGQLIATARLLQPRRRLRRHVVITVVALLAESLMTMVEHRLLNLAPRDKRERVISSAGARRASRPWTPCCYRECWRSSQVASQRAPDPDAAAQLVDQIARERIDAIEAQIALIGLRAPGESR